MSLWKREKNEIWLRCVFAAVFECFAEKSRWKWCLKGTIADASAAAVFGQGWSWEPIDKFLFVCREDWGGAKMKAAGGEKKSRRVFFRCTGLRTEGRRLAKGWTFLKTIEWKLFYLGTRTRQRHINQLALLDRILASTITNAWNDDQQKAFLHETSFRQSSKARLTIIQGSSDIEKLQLI